MPFPFNRFPRGLVGLLDAKTRGTAPTSLADEVRGTLDMMPFYQAATREVLSGVTLAPVAEGPVFATGGNLIVPQDELWIVWHFTAIASLVLATGETLAFTTLLRAAAAVGVNQDQVLNSSFGNGGVGSLPVAWTPSPFLALPGDSLGIFVTFHVLTANPVNLSALTTRLKL